MRRERSLPAVALALALAAAGCGGGAEKKKDPPPRKEERATTAPVGTAEERVEMRVGDRRALIYTWRGRFPRTIADGDIEWILSEDEFVKTEDFANAWKVVYCTKDGSKLLLVAACEYVSEQAASESYASFVSKVETPGALAAPEGCEKATSAKLGDDALAAVLSKRYLFIFDRRGAAEVGAPVVAAVVKACFTEPRGE